MRPPWWAALALLSACVPMALSPETGNAKWGLEITSHGHSCFTFRDSMDRTVVVDPFDETVGYPPLSLKADALLITHAHFDHANRAAVRAKRKDIDLVMSTGTWTVASGLQVTGLASFHDNKGGQVHGPNTIYVFVMGGLRVVDLGDIGHPELTEFQKRMIGTVDVLFVPVGGATTLDATEARHLVQELKPRAVLPMHYGNQRFFRFAELDDFLKLFDASNIVRVSDSTVRLRDADLGDGPVIYVLTPVGRSS